MWFQKKLQSNFIEITLRHGCSLANLLHIFRTFLPKNTSGGLLLEFKKGRSNVVLNSFGKIFRNALVATILPIATISSKISRQLFSMVT